jgi:hypothetical protein
LHKPTRSIGTIMEESTQIPKRQARHLPYYYDGERWSDIAPKHRIRVAGSIFTAIFIPNCMS